MLDTFTKQLRRANIRFVLSLCPSVHVKQLDSQWMNIRQNFCWEFLLKTCLQRLTTYLLTYSMELSPS